MADPLRKKPLLQIIREGNPSKTALPESLQLPPAELAEPDWSDTFPTVHEKAAQDVNRRAREIARREWRRVVPRRS